MSVEKTNELRCTPIDLAVKNELGLVQNKMVLVEIFSLLLLLQNFISVE